jgi:hypothetical protein
MVECEEASSNPACDNEFLFIPDVGSTACEQAIPDDD